MHRLTAPLAAAAAAVLITLGATSMTSRAAGSYADDRSEIEDLQARYLFAMDFHDPDLYVTTFTEDGILDVGEIKGREAIRQTIARMPQPVATAGMRPAVGRHNISNIVLKIDGNRSLGEGGSRAL